MPPEEKEQREVDQEKPKSSKKKLFIILPVVILLLGGGAAGAYFKFFKAQSDEKAAESKTESPVIQEMDTFMVNLADAGGRRFLKATIKAKMDSLQAAEEFKSRGFEMRDLVLTLLSGKESEEVSRAEDKQTLKREITAAINRALHKGKVLDIYFTEFLVQ